MRPATFSLQVRACHGLGSDRVQSARRGINQFALLTHMSTPEISTSTSGFTSSVNGQVTNDSSPHQAQAATSNKAGAFPYGWWSTDKTSHHGTDANHNTVRQNDDDAPSNSSGTKRVLKNAVRGAMLATGGCVAGMTAASLVMSIPAAVVIALAPTVLLAAVVGGATGGALQDVTAGWRASVTDKIAGAMDKIGGWGASLVNSIKSHWPFK